MGRILLLILIAGGVFLVILLVSRADLWKDFWLWIVGLAGPIVKIADLLYQKVKQWVTGSTNKEDADFIARQTDKASQNEQ